MDPHNHPNKSIDHYLTVDAATATVNCLNEWTLTETPIIDHYLKSITWPTTTKLIINGAKLIKMDSAGAWCLLKLLQLLQDQGYETTRQAFAPEFESIINLIAEQKDLVTQPHYPKELQALAAIGKNAVTGIKHSLNFLSFIGEIAVVGIQLLNHIRLLHWRAFLAVIEDTGFRALPIIALLSFLIGVVLTYQMGLQLGKYGANIFIVDLLGLSLLREFGPLITAIIVAGRSGSSFAAQIGTMKINEEIDALSTMGIMPSELLVIPKCLAMIIVLPLLVVWADIFGVFGGMVMANHLLGINYPDFLHRFQASVSLASFATGIYKAPVFGILIACIGCYHGFQVTQSAESVGRQTTNSVVQAIFLIIVADALFSILFSALGI